MEHPDLMPPMPAPPASLVDTDEIERQLRGHGWVAEAAVLRRGAAGRESLVCFLVPAAAAGRLSLERVQAERVKKWQWAFDHDMGSSSGEFEDGVKFTGWKGRVSGEAIPEAEMRAWLKDRVDAITALDPRRILELGCGTGLLLFQLAPLAQAYLGLDISAVSLRYVADKLGKFGAWAPRVELWEREAKDLAGVERGRFDTVILNSVAQYFPDESYLGEVLANAMMALDRGSVFVGDLRDLRLLPCFSAAVELAREPDRTLLGDLRRKVERKAALESELMVAPAYFKRLQRDEARVASVELRLQRGGHRNELNQYRYDAVLRLGPAGAEAGRVDWRAWDPSAGLGAAKARLAAGGGAAWGVRGVPNARLAADLRAWRALMDGAAGDSVGGLRARLAAAGDAGGVEPESFWGLGEEFGIRVKVAPNLDDPGLFDVCFLPKDRATEGECSAGGPWSGALVNQPSKRELGAELGKRLKEHLQGRVPDAWQPSQWIVLDALPLGPDGAVDRGAL